VTPRTQLKGQKFSKLLVISDSRAGRDGKSVCDVRCDCGVEKEVRTAVLLNGNTRSCGCTSFGDYRRVRESGA